MVLVLYILEGIQNIALGTETTQLIISEIYPAPSTGEQEWVELYNPTTTEISLAGYTILDELSTPSILFTGSTEMAPPQGYVVLSLSGSKLNNTGDSVHLISPENIKIDSLTFSSSSQGKSWQRLALTSTEITLVTPTKGNASTEYPFFEVPALAPVASVSAQPTTLPSTPTPTPTPTPKPGPSASATPIPIASPTPAPAPLRYDQLHLSEIMSCPASGSEWIELYNASTQEMSMSGFKVQDESGNTKIISGSIPAGEYTTFSWTGSLLNNSGDTVDLITPTGSLNAHAEFSNCSAGTSFVFTADPAPGQWTTAQPTPGKPNVILTQSQLNDPLTTQQTTQTEALFERPFPPPQAEVLGEKTTAFLGTVKTSSSLMSLNLSAPATQSASISGFFKDSVGQKIQTVPVNMYIQKGFLLFACIGAFTGGTLLLYEKIKETMHPLA